MNRFEQFARASLMLAVALCLPLLMAAHLGYRPLAPLASEWDQWSVNHVNELEFNSHQHAIAIDGLAKRVTDLERKLGRRIGNANPSTTNPFPPVESNP